MSDDNVESPNPRQAPNDIESELYTLGGLLLQPDKYIDIEGKLDAEDFFNPGYGLIFSAFRSLREAGTPVTLPLLRHALEQRGDLQKVGGAIALAALADSVSDGSHIEHYAKIVREKSVLRRMIKAATAIIEDATEGGLPPTEVIDRAEKAIFQIAAQGTQGEPQTMSVIVQAMYERLHNLAQPHAVHPDVISTDYYELDQMLAGLHGGELIIIAGRPSMGKSTFALNIARRVALTARQGVLIFSLEMTAVNMATNIFSAFAKIDAEKLRKPRVLADHEWEEIVDKVDALNSADIIIDDSAQLSITEMRGKARRVRQKHSVSLIIVDYLQLMQGSARSAQRSREQEVAEISRGLKALAKELNVPVIALSQLNRKTEDRSGNRPMMSDLRESGAIEQDADVILLLHRPCYYNPEDKPGVAEVIIAKQRNGPTGTVELTFLNQQLRFESVSHQHPDN